MDLDNGSKRIEWVDCAKGIGMLLILLGHTTKSFLVVGSIYSFHMPLFFILSCLTFKLSEDNDQFVRKTEKAFKHLIGTALIIYAIYFVFGLISDFGIIKEYGYEGWKMYLGIMLRMWVFGSGNTGDFLGAVIPGIGFLWFLIALFWGRTLFDWLHLKSGADNKKFIIYLCVCTLAGVAVGKIAVWPQSFDNALAVMPFFWFGNFLKKSDIINKSLPRTVFFFVIWIGLLAVFFNCGTYLEFTVRDYPLFPLCHIAAVAGSMLVIYLSRVIVGLGKIAVPLVYIGENSILLYCVHAVEAKAVFIWEGNTFLYNFIIKLMLDLSIFYLLTKAAAYIKNKKITNHSQVNL